MLSSAVYFFSLLNLLLHISSQETCLYPPPHEIILLNCGTSSSSNSPDHLRLWNGDSSNSKFTFSDLEKSSEESNATIQAPGIETVPFMTARISYSNLTYSFPNISPGPKFIRLYFYPATYTSPKPSTDFNFNSSESLFTVTANNFTLLKNFSAFLNLLAPIPQERTASLIKEFIVTVQKNQTLNISFIPSPSSLVFINAIEIAPIPENLYIKDKDSPITLVNFQIPYYYNDFTALETLYRLNVAGGFVIDPEMFRRWSDDTNYYTDGGPVSSVQRSHDKIKYTPKTTPCYAAPPLVYQTMRSMGPRWWENPKYNLTWKFSVDSGFEYLVRLHFCETDKFVNAAAKRVFTIFVNNFLAADLDVFNLAGGNDIPVYQDYIVQLPQENLKKKEFFISLHPRSIHFTDAILNGLEIFKLSKLDGDLSGPNPEQPSILKQPLGDSRKSERKSESRVLPIIGGVIGVFSVLCLLVFLIFYVRKAKKKDVDHRSNLFPFSYTSSSSPTPVPLLPTDLCRQFTLPEIRTATRNFDSENVIGSGGFGTVYNGYIKNGLVSIPVAIKRLDSSSKQGTKEFHTEIEMLSRLRHAHLVSLIGYCDEEDEMILVYEFMDQGNLQDLYKAKKVPFPWKQRLKICIGAAKGLHYLHTGVKNTIIHRDVKSCNILLDSNLVAKVSDFGLSKIGPISESQTHVSTVVRGTFGYLDPEYFRRHQLTEKSDVYSFGVVLLEVIYGRAPIVPTEPKEQMNLVQWARKCFKKGTVGQSIDPQLKGDIAAVSLNKFMEIAESCVREKATERPVIGDVVWGLEFSLQLQETTEKNEDDGDDNIGGKGEKSSFVDYYGGGNNKDDHDMFTSSSSPILPGSSNQSNFSISDSDPARPENVFSEIMNQDGR